MMEKITIKKTKRFQEAYKIAIGCPDYFMKECWHEIKNDIKKNILFGAFLKNKMVGFVVYGGINKNVVEMQWVAINKEFRHNGIGTELVKKSLGKIAQKYKLCKVRTLAEIRKDEGYSRTRNFYEKLGFYWVEIVDPYPYWRGRNPCQIYIKII